MKNFLTGSCGALIAGTLLLSGCSRSNPPVPATLTLNKDRSQFSGNVVRRDSTSITLVGDEGATRTFLLTEVSDIHFGTPSQKADIPPMAPPADVPLPEGVPAVIRIPAGTQIPVRTGEFIDSCCTRIGTIELGVSDADVKRPGGNVLIPEGANLTFIVRDKRVSDGRDALQFELGSADFGHRHYLMSSAGGGQNPGAVLTLSGPGNLATESSGKMSKTLHLDDNSLIQFRAETPVEMKLSK